MDKEIYDRSKLFWKMAINYLTLVSAALEESVKRENRWCVSSDSSISGEDYKEQTKWSDFNIIIPLLFNFYHGIELLLKGFVLLAEAKGAKPNHNIERLLKAFRSSDPDQREMVSVLTKYIEISEAPDLLREFFDENKCSARRFYEVLRYPSDKHETSFTHDGLKFRESESLPFFKGMIEDINTLCRCSVRLGRSREPSV